MRFSVGRSQESISISSGSVSRTVFALAMKTANELTSEPKALRPASLASITEVPPPEKGSKTTCPGLENASTARRANTGENRAGYL